MKTNKKLNKKWLFLLGMVAILPHSRSLYAANGREVGPLNHRQSSEIKRAKKNLELIKEINFPAFIEASKAKKNPTEKKAYDYLSTAVLYSRDHFSSEFKKKLSSYKPKKLKGTNVSAIELWRYLLNPEGGNSFETYEEMKQYWADYFPAETKLEPKVSINSLEETINTTVQVLKRWFDGNFINDAGAKVDSTGQDILIKKWLVEDELSKIRNGEETPFIEKMTEILGSKFGGRLKEAISEFKGRNRELDVLEEAAERSASSSRRKTKEQILGDEKEKEKALKAYLKKLSEKETIPAHGHVGVTMSQDLGRKFGNGIITHSNELTPINLEDKDEDEVQPPTDLTSEPEPYSPTSGMMSAATAAALLGTASVGAYQYVSRREAQKKTNQEEQLNEGQEQVPEEEQDE